MPLQQKNAVFVVDDDPAFNTIMQFVLKNFGLTAEVFPSCEALMKRLTEALPSLLIVDLNLDGLKKGFEVVEAFRANHSKTVPVFIVSATKDTSSIAHAIEIGADDYLLKPLDREIFASKLLNYLTSAKLEDMNLNIFRAVGNQIAASVEVEFEIREIDELGIKIYGKHLFMKGAALFIGSPLIDEITGIQKPFLFTVASTWVEPSENGYGAYLEFTPYEEDVAMHIRSWLTIKTSGTSPEAHTDL